MLFGLNKLSCDITLKNDGYFAYAFLSFFIAEYKYPCSRALSTLYYNGLGLSRNGTSLHRVWYDLKLIQKKI